MTRVAGAMLAVIVAGFATVFAGAEPAAAAQTKVCTPAEWMDKSNFKTCVDGMADAAQNKCVQAPTPREPDAGMAGWFASKPASGDKDGINGMYTTYGYAGYDDYTTYDIDCVKTVMHPDYKFENTIANGEFMVATGILGASNAIREKAWDPATMYGWADPLVERVTKALYDRVFTVLGVVVLSIVGLHLIWRSRRADISHAVTTAGWSVLVIVVVTAVARWPMMSAHAADDMLTGSLSTVHTTLSATTKTAGECRNLNPNACLDKRAPAQAVSDSVTEGLIFRNWERGLLGNPDSDTARKYGLALYTSKVMSWADAESARHDPDQRKVIIEQKQRDWNKIAAQIKKEDPGAYETLQGINGMDRIGAGFVAMLAAGSFVLFDVAASILVLVGFLIFRWAVVALPLIGTIALFRGWSGGLRHVGNVVVGSVFNIVVFGAGAAIYVFFVDQILSTAALAGWVQVLLILLTGVVGWITLRPYRRMRHLGGRDPVRIVVDGAKTGAQIDQAVAKRVKAGISGTKAAKTP